MNKKFVIAFLAFVLLSAIVIAEENLNTGASIPTPVSPGVKYEYAAKFVCGTPISPTGGLGPVVPGIYLTAINVHNPQIFNVTLTKEVVQALSEDQQPIPPSQSRTIKMLPDNAFEIDCQDIAAIGHITTPFFKGFVIINTPKQLDVVGVYTSTTTQFNNTDINVVPVSPKAILPPTGTTAADVPID